MEPRYIANVVVLELGAEKCIGCGMCAEVCPRGVFTLQGGKAEIADRDACMECGACARNCPVGAIAAAVGVGCAAAVLTGRLSGTEPTCRCSDGSGDPCCE